MAKPADCKSAIIGSNPIGASLYVGSAACSGIVVDGSFSPYDRGVLHAHIRESVPAVTNLLRSLCCTAFQLLLALWVLTFITSVAQWAQAKDPPIGALRGLIPRTDSPPDPQSAPMVVILGGTNAHEMQRHGYLETMLAAGAPDRAARLRNLAWQADTVYRQQRPRNFYLDGLAPPNQEPDHRGRIAADTIILWMGENEALDARSPKTFAKAYSQLVEQLRPFAHRLLLVTPVPFEDPLKLGINLDSRNSRLAQHVKIIRDVAQQKHLDLVDLHRAAGEQPGQPPLTRDGSHLNGRGQWWVAAQLASALQSDPVVRLAEPSWPEGEFDAQAEAVRQRVLAKNQLWMRYWRPTNWAFLYGNRQFVESSRDHVNYKNRWFPAAVESLASPMDQAEVEIQAAARSISR